LTTASRPDGRAISLGYDTGGRLATRSLITGGATTGTDTLGYDDAGRLSSLAASSGVTTTYTYEGALLSAETWSGPVSGRVNRSYDTSLRLASQSVDGSDGVSFNYDADGLLIEAGALAIVRDPQNGLPTGSTLGVVSTTAGYNGFGEVVTYAASASGVAFYSLSFTRDALGRVTQKAETIGGTTDVYIYTYDATGQLTGVSKGGIAVESYGYDDNRNRTSATVAGVTVSGTYDLQDRLNQYGTIVYTYDGAGDLQTRTRGGQTTAFEYDQLGNLLGATLADATAVTYVVDGYNRRVGKKVNGVLVQGLIYGDRLRPVAELDGSGSVVSRFVYAGRGAAAFMVRGGVTYRIITDQVGSVRLVVDSGSGVVAQRIDYDSFGKVTQDTNPGFQPFGFAGGLYDADTGLVRFGARDYDAEPGRWTTKDPIGFAGGLNVQAYVENDPVNSRDPSGLLSPSQCGRIMEMLASEQEIGTDRTARKFSNTIGTDRMGVQFDNVPITTAAGTIDFDWWTDLTAFSFVNDAMVFPFFGVLTGPLGAGNLLTPVEYLVGNTTWGLLNGNLLNQFNMLEAETVGYIMLGFDTYAELFPPGVLAAEGCPCPQ
jgi:RHS repeat-associated protein